MNKLTFVATSIVVALVILLASIYSVVAWDEGVDIIAECDSYTVSAQPETLNHTPKKGLVKYRWIPVEINGVGEFDWSTNLVEVEVTWKKQWSWKWKNDWQNLKETYTESYRDEVSKPDDCQEEEPEPTPTPQPTPQPVPLSEPSGPVENNAKAPVFCPNGDYIKPPANVHIWRKGGDAKVVWVSTQGDKSNIYWKVNGNSDWMYSLIEQPNTGYYEIHDLGSMDITFGVQQIDNHCVSEVVSVVDDSTDGWVLFR